MAQSLLKKVCSGGGKVQVGVRGGEGAESEHVEEDDGRESVGETGDASSVSSAAWDGSTGLTSRIGSSSTTSRFNPNSDDKSLMNAQYLSAGNAYGCDWMKDLTRSTGFSGAVRLHEQTCAPYKLELMVSFFILTKPS